MTRDKLIKKIATWIMMAIMLSVFSLDIICVAMCNRYQNKFEITPAQFSSDGTADRIHFLNTYNSDAILIESNGKFALLDSGEGEQRQLHPGEIARYNTATQKLDIRRGHVELESCWAAGKLVFERQSLGEICRYLSRWYDIRIDISPALARNYAYTFTITDEPLEAILRIMSRINPIVYTFSDNRSVSISEVE